MSIISRFRLRELIFFDWYSLQLVDNIKSEDGQEHNKYFLRLRSRENF